MSEIKVNPYESPQVEETAIDERELRAAFWPLLWRSAMYSAFYGVALGGTGGAVFAVICLPVMAIADGVMPTVLEFFMVAFMAALMYGMLGCFVGALVSPVAALAAKRGRRETLFSQRRNTMWCYAVLWMMAACIPSWVIWNADGPSVGLAAFLCLAIVVSALAGLGVGVIVAERLHRNRFGNVPYSPFLHRQ